MMSRPAESDDPAAAAPRPRRTAPSTAAEEEDEGEDRKDGTGGGNPDPDRAGGGSRRYVDDLRDTAHLFLLLPPQVLVVLFLEILNTFRGWGFRFVAYDYITNEFGLSDSEAGFALGIKGLLDALFGLTGSTLVDLHGVRNTSIFALSIAVFGRTILTFGRSKYALYVSLFFFSPAGESLLSAGLYRVALKKLTTPKTRPLAFAIQYAASNFAGGIADVVVDAMRENTSDATVFGMVFTPTRKFVALTLAATGSALAVAISFLRDLTVADPSDPEEEEDLDGAESIPDDAEDCPPMLPCLVARGSGGGRGRRVGKYKIFETVSGTATDARAARRRPPPTADGAATAAALARGNGGGDGRAGAGAVAAADRGSDADEEDGVAVAPPRSSTTTTTSSLATDAQWIARQLRSLLRLRSTWRMLLFGFASFAVGTQWSAMEIVLPTYLERHDGEKSPIYVVQSINLWGCLVFPPLIGFLLSRTEDFRVVMPGMWLMACAPLAAAMLPPLPGSCLWMTFMTAGEVLWSPRIVSWTASLAPSGREGLFFAIGSARTLLGPLADYALGKLNDAYDPNCVDCRDRFGHFCDEAHRISNGGESLYECRSEEETCGNMVPTTDPQACPTTCRECPGWESNPRVLWSALLFASLASPLATWTLLPFLRGRKSRFEGFYGIVRCGLRRALGVCGAEEEDEDDDDDEASRRSGVRRRRRAARYERVKAKDSSLMGDDDVESREGRGTDDDEIELSEREFV